ncbi:MAG TPA: hypothetical protein VHN77_00560 [Phycisphaerales bacterium]|nr:hypothetical protein [Phycisphaerales bacterium]
MDFGVGQHVAGAEFQEGRDACDEVGDAVIGEEHVEAADAVAVHLADVGHVVGAVEPVVDEFEFFVGEVCGHGGPPARCGVR